MVIRSITVLVLVMLSLCSSVIAQNQPSKILITIKRQACFGSCPIYSAKIYSDGTVVYHGEEFVKVRGEQRHTITMERLAELVRAFERANYFAMKDRYEVDEKGHSMTDLPRTTTSISLNGKTKKVIDYYCPPKELVVLEELIDKLAGLYEYIGPL